MTIQKLTTTDAFIAFDFDGVPSVGVTRRAPKVLADGAELLARSTTYALASFGIEMGGASAGLNATDEDRDAAVAAFVTEVRPMVESGRWLTDPGVGISEADLAPLRDVDPRPAALWADGLAAALAGQGAAAAAAAVRDGGLAGASCAVVGAGPISAAASDAVAAAGGTVGANAIDADCDVLFLAGKAGMLDHDAAATVRASIVVPLTPVPVTARAHAVLSAAGRVHVPDFLSTAAPLVAAHAPGDAAPVAAVSDAVAALAGEGTGLWLAAVEAAESFLRTWRDELPFGRPLA